MKKILYILMILFTFTTLVACGEESDPSNEPFDITKVTVDDLTVTYDGNVHSIVLPELPDGYRVSYMNNFKSEVGVYDVSIVVYDENNKIVLNLVAKLTILEKEETPNIDSIILVSKTFIYDGKEHSIEVSNLPQGYRAEYTGNGVSEIGKHTVTAKIYDSNNQLVLTLDAVINIVKQSNVELPLV